MLLLGLVVVSVVVPGSLLLAGYLDDADDGPPIDLDAVANEAHLTLHHAGGRSLAAEDVSVVLRQNGTEHWSELATWSLANGGDQFSPADRARLNYTALGFDAGQVQMLVVHRPTESLLLDETLRIGPGTGDPPTPTPTADFTVACDGVACEFDASGSSDPDGSIESYEWTFGDGDAGTGESVTHSYDARGSYTVELTVTDDDGATDTASQGVDVVPNQPTLSGIVVDDDSRHGTANYRVHYDVENTTEFDRVEVEFDNQANDWADQVVTNESARGYVDYSQSGEGDTYNITVRAYNGSDVVTDSVSITDTADGDDSGDGNLSSPGDPEFDGIVVDDASTSEASYEFSYNVTNRSEFGHVEIEVENLDRSWASTTLSSSEPRDNVEGYSESTYGDEYRATLSLHDSSGVVVDEVVVDDVADGTDPAGNDDLSRPGSPSLSNWVIADESTPDGGAAYDVTYSADATAEYAGVEVIFRNRDSQHASETSPVSAGSSGTISHLPGPGFGDQYEIEVRVVDTDGIVVDEYVASDVADGSNPAGNEPPSSPTGPQFAGVAVDDVSTVEATYEVSYNVTNRDEFDHVEVEIENLDSSHASATYTSTDPRDNVDEYGESTHGDSYRITVNLVDGAGFTVDEVVVTDVADGTDPAGNDDLSRASSPTLTSHSITDRSNNGQGAWFDVTYEASATAEFAGVEVIFRNRNDQYASETAPLATAATGTISHQPGYSYGSQYEIEIRVVDADGIVVDDVIVSDAADGTDP